MMKYRIVNLFAMFHNPYNEPGWQLWHGNDLIGIYYTRAEVRAARKDRYGYRKAKTQRTCACDFDCDQQDPTSCVPCEGNR